MKWKRSPLWLFVWAITRRKRPRFCKSGHLCRCPYCGKTSRCGKELEP